MNSGSEAQDRGEHRGRWILEGIVVTAIPAIGYAVAFVHEAGFLSWFGAPLEFITVNITTVLISVFFLLLLIFFLFGVTNLIFMFIRPKRDDPIFRGLVVLLPAILLTVSYIVLFGEFWKQWIWLAGLLVFYTFLEFVFPLFGLYKKKRPSGKAQHYQSPGNVTEPVSSTQPEKLSYRDKLEAQNRFDAKFPTLSDYFSGAAWTWFFIGYLVLFLLSLSWSSGLATAMRQVEYPIPSTHQEAVVLRIYGDNLICATIDKQRKEVQKDFFVLNISNSPIIEMRLEKVGPLRPRQIE